jgi:aminopeptidase N
MTFGQQLSAGTSYTLNIKFNGNLTDQLAGFYRSSYTNDAGVKRWIATTQFEATDARFVVSLPFTILLSLKPIRK